MTTVAAPVSSTGLSDDEVADRRARGLANDLPDAPTRSVGEIVKANVFTYFNLLLGSLFVIILVVGPSNDALFGGVIIANTVVGVVQEVRAKRTLDRLAVLSSPRARVRRNGTAGEIPVNEVVLDDVLLLEPGDQVVVDGEVLTSSSIEIDESLLTGESDPVLKEPGNPVMSGSFVAAGSGSMRATRVGREAYASQVAEEARRFTLARSELRSGIDFIVHLVSYLMVPTGILLLVSQLHASDGIAESIRGTVAGVVAMVPEGLVLLTSVAFAVGIVRLGRRQVLVQELPAIETLARIDTICLDKTGTLTEGDLALDRLVAGPGADEAGSAAALRAVIAAESAPNSTMRAVQAGLPAAAPGEVLPTPTAHVPFSSARKWSAATFGADGTWVLGAPDVVLRAIPDSPALGAAVETYATQGKRVLLLAHTDQPITGPDALPPGLAPHTLALLEDKVRADAAETLHYFADQGVTVKVISGDHPATVAAVARKVGLDPDGTLVGIDAVTLPDDPEALAEAVDAGTVFGRVTPQQKRAMVKALQARGHIVAMTGDGVNDVLALKDADIGVAMGSGSAASRSAAQLVLLDQRFASLPEVVAEGRRAIANVERVANLFLTKTVYSMLLALAVGVLGLPFPFLPRHLTLVGALTIGIPAFFLALAPNDRRAEPHFVARVLRFAVPCGTLAAVATFSGYYLARVDGSLTLDQERTTATLVLVSIGLLVLVTLASPLNRSRRILVAAMLGGFLLVLAIPAGRTYFALSLPPLPIVMAAVGVVALAALVLHGATRLVALYHAPFERLMAAQSNREQREADDRADRNEEDARLVTAPEPVTAEPPTAVPAEPPGAVPAEPPTAVTPTAVAPSPPPAPEATAPLPAEAAATTALPDSPEPTTPLRPPDPEAHG